MRMAREFMRQGNRMFEQQNLTAAQAETLFFLTHREMHGEGTAIQRDIEEALRLSNPTVSGTIDRLEKKGFVTRQSNPENRRVNRIVLTAKARALHEEAHKSWRELEERMLSPLTGDEREELLRIVEKILVGISDGDSERGGPCSKFSNI